MSGGIDGIKKKKTYRIVKKIEIEEEKQDKTRKRHVNNLRLERS